jgi:uncharacterized protein (DUF305 family)
VVGGERRTRRYENLLKEMIAHHDDAIAPSRQCQDRAFHAELKSLCEDIVSVQLSEIELMRRWLCEWFGECNFVLDPNRPRTHPQP